jgi:hypothetical protein
MGHSILIPNGILSLAETDFKCPNCDKKYSEEFYYKVLEKSKKTYIYKKCLVCSAKMGISSDFRGDIVVWLKNEI